MKGNKSTSLSYLLAFAVAAASGIAGYIAYRIRHRKRELFLGFDVSTQSLKAIVINSNQEIVFEDHIVFDEQFPHYQTTDGVLRDNKNPSKVTAPSLMFVEAMDVMLKRLNKNVNLSLIRGISGSGQQHSSVFWKTGALSILSSLDSSRDLKDQLENAFSLDNAPIWMDSSTDEQCKQLEEDFGGPQALANVTGSRAYERFTGNQIAKIRKELPEVYANTERIALVSSFVASLMIGDYAPIDRSDGSGMNMMNIYTSTWSEKALKSIGGDADSLSSKLGTPTHSHEVIGNISPYFIEKYNFSKDCKIVAFSGDNPCALAGFRASSPGDVIISLGTSSTVLSLLDHPKPSGDEGHVLCSPINPNSFIGMLCFKNGALARKYVCNEQAKGSWTQFEALVNKSPTGNNNNIAFFYQVPEITPTTQSSGIFRFNAVGEHQTQPFPPEVECRAILESQCLSLRVHCEKLGVCPRRILVTGGASGNQTILQLLADVFGCDVFVSSEGNEAAAMGASLRALHGVRCSENQAFVSFSTIAAPDYKKMASSRPEAFKLYTQMLPRFSDLEKTVVQMTHL